MASVFVQKLITRGLVWGLSALLLLPAVPVAAQEGPAIQHLKDQLIRENWRSLPIAPGMESAPAPDTRASGTPLAPEDVLDWSRLAFQSYRDGNWEVYLSRGDGRDQSRVTHNPAVDGNPKLNRGATRIAFNSDRSGNLDVYAVNIDGSHLSRLTTGTASEVSPTWSPSGQRIAFLSNSSGNWDVWAMNADGSSQVRMTSSAADDVSPAWSPDGNTIVWVRRGSSSNELWLMNADGSNPRRLAAGLRYLENLAWSPNGSQLAFDYDSDGDYWNELATINANGSQLQTVYDLQTNLVDAWLGSWSPDGAWLVFSRVEYIVVANQLYIRQAYVEKVSSIPYGQPQRLIASGFDLRPHWETTDRSAPVTAMQPLPAYSRAAGFDVSWSGQDTGGSGVAGYEVQYQVGTGGGWTPWYRGATTTQPFTVAVPGGQTVAFRARAWDTAGNVEGWPAQPGSLVTTTTYTYLLAGTVTDAKGVPVPNVNVSISPTPVTVERTDARGAYQARLAAQGAHSVVLSHAGYGQRTTATSIYGDLDRSAYLPATQNWAQNGDFETSGGSLQGWTIGGSLANSVRTSAGYFSQTAAALHQRCPYPCLTDPVPTWTGGYSYPDLATDAGNNLHMVWDGWEQGRGVLYAVRTPDGAWHGPEKLMDLSSYSDVDEPGVAVDGMDRLHVVWTGSLGVYYSQRVSGGDWSEPEVIAPDSGSAAIAADRKGGVHVIYHRSDSAFTQVVYRERLADGRWQAPIVLSGDRGYYGPHIVVGQDDMVHFLWQEIGGSIFYANRPENGSISTPVRIFSDSGYTFDRQRLAVDREGTVHAYWSWAHSGYYAYRSPEGSWSAPVGLPKALGSADLAVDPQGIVHMIGESGAAGEEGTYYRQRLPNGQWTSPHLLTSNIGSLHSVATAVDRAGIFHGVWVRMSDDKLVYQSTDRAEEAGTASLSQRVSIPADAQRPTLSFYYELAGIAASDGPSFEVNVHHGISETVVFSRTTSEPWTLGWAELSDWAGQPITLTFTMQQTPGLPRPRLALDDVSMGSWRTPVVLNVTPAELPFGLPTEITISGDNFIGVPTVTLGSVALGNVQVVQANTLRATVPATMAPGQYFLKVRNPEGQVSAYPERVRIGYFFFLPWLPVY